MKSRAKDKLQSGSEWESVTDTMTELTLASRNLVQGETLMKCLDLLLIFTEDVSGTVLKCFLYYPFNVFCVCRKERPHLFCIFYR